MYIFVCEILFILNLVSNKDIEKFDDVSLSLTMHPVRRRKKRPNYGVRMVEVNRGKNGFGFTISGQQPCILSCIVPGSPADQAGLRAGDYLVAVSNHNVSKLLHDDVVQLIGGCQSALRLQIAENYYSDSSDEEFKNELGRQRPKYPHKSRPALTPINVNKMKKDNNDYGVQFAHVSKPCIHNNCSTYNKEEITSYNFQVVVKYLGTIEMPCIPAGSRLQVSNLFKHFNNKTIKTIAVVSGRLFQNFFILYHNSCGDIEQY